MSSGLVIWLTGLSGVGKTTTARALSSALKKQFDCSVVQLDGDELREVFGNASYTQESRQQLAMQYAALAKLLSRQGHWVICSTISLFHTIHQWNRKHLPRYMEVLLETDIETLIERDTRQVYQKSGTGLVVGQSLAAEFPLQPHLRLASRQIEDINLNVSAIIDRIADEYLQEKEHGTSTVGLY